MTYLIKVNDRTPWTPCKRLFVVQATDKEEAEEMVLRALNYNVSISEVLVPDSGETVLEFPIEKITEPLGHWK